MEPTGVQLTDKYDLFGESYDYYNTHTLFHKGFGEVQSKQKMLEDAKWKYKHRNTSVIGNCPCFEDERGIRIGLCFCISLCFIIGTLIIITDNNAASVFGCIVFYLIAICLFTCFIIRTNEYINEHGLICCKKPKKETMLTFDDFKINFMKSGGLYFDKKHECIYDIQILVNYSENTDNEIIYIQNKKKLCEFDNILEIGFNEATNEHDWTQYGLYDSLPSVSHTIVNRNDHDHRTLIIKYENEDEPSTSVSQSQSQSQYASHIKVSDALHSINENNIKLSDAFQLKPPNINHLNSGEKKWRDHKLTKREFTIKMLRLKKILNLIQLSEQVIVKDEPYKTKVINPVVI